MIKESSERMKKTFFGLKMRELKNYFNIATNDEKLQKKCVIFCK